MTNTYKWQRMMVMSSFGIRQRNETSATIIRAILANTHEVKIRYQIILSHERGRQSESAMCLHGANDTAKHLGWYDVYLVHEQKPPFPPAYGLHDLLRLVATLSAVRNHSVGRNEDAPPGGMDVVLYVGREHGYVIVGDVRPQLELILPLQYRYGIGTKAYDRFLNGLRGRDPREGLAGPAGQDDDTRSCTSVPEHLSIKTTVWEC
jgi:hypothetical protein